jgi:peptide deformylase
MINVQKCRITHYPAEVLGGRAQPIEKIDENIRQLVKKMTDIMLENKGIGLAGPQAGVPLRIFIISLDGTRQAVKVYINPTVTPTGVLDSVEEGCLSVPGVYAKIRRALQHEYDHIEGVTIADRMGPAAKISHRKQLKKLREEHKSTGA